MEKGTSTGTGSPEINQPLPVHTGDLESNRASTLRARVRTTLTIREEGESGRRGIHPIPFMRIVFQSSSWASRIVNVLWPVVPVAIAVRYAVPDQNLVIFILAYLAMIPCANLLGFAGNELARKVPHVAGVLTETTLGSLTEVILFIVLITRNNDGHVDYIQVIKAAILGSVLATMLLCLGLCFIAGGFKRHEQNFSEAVSEAGSGLLLTAGLGLAIPTVFKHSLTERLAEVDLQSKAVDISRSTAILLMVAYLIFIYFQTQTHHGIYDAIFVGESANGKHHKNNMKHRLTFTEVVIALAASIALVAIISIILVDKIQFLVEDRHVSDAFVGLILVPLGEKAAEHLTAIDEAYNNQMNFALSHVLGATLQTALFNGPLVVIIGWGLGKPMGLDFEIFDMVVLLLAIITVGNFLRDQKSNYLEGSLCVIVYVAIAVAALYYPNPVHGPAAAAETGAASNVTTVDVEHHRF
ncbi:hypothetical protein B0T24DRAFT_532384 [Lasiosphaeria ovina]|uniref:Vacuolar calcium ion transporter n=1 Tax=Lasiosphaeria ovina TaxID=92902 RepID=A0AAE0K2K6_9PEZI|nr:hypothetical protein B0T24DRAFT_532384 [Lasiosphaeria ovina]